MALRVYTAEVDIEADPALVWETLTDLEGYRRWNPFTLTVRSPLTRGAPVDMDVRMLALGGLQVRQRETVRAVEPERRLVWGMTMLGGAIEAERTQTLVPLPNGRTRYRTEDVIEGPLGGLVFTLFGPSIQRGFDEMAWALRDEVARRRRST